MSLAKFLFYHMQFIFQMKAKNNNWLREILAKRKELALMRNILNKMNYISKTQRVDFINLYLFEIYFSAHHKKTEQNYVSACHAAEHFCNVVFPKWAPYMYTVYKTFKMASGILQVYEFMLISSLKIESKNVYVEKMLDINCLGWVSGTKSSSLRIWLEYMGLEFISNIC